MPQGPLPDAVKILVFAVVAYVIAGKWIIDRVTGRKSSGGDPGDGWLGDDSHHGTGHDGGDGGGHH